MGRYACAFLKLEDHGINNGIIGGPGGFPCTASSDSALPEQDYDNQCRFVITLEAVGPRWAKSMRAPQLTHSSTSYHVKDFSLPWALGRQEMLPGIKVHNIASGPIFTNSAVQIRPLVRGYPGNPGSPDAFVPRRARYQRGNLPWPELSTHHIAASSVATGPVLTRDSHQILKERIGLVA